MKRKRGNVKSKAKQAPVCNVDEVIQNVVHANRHEWGLDDHLEAKQRVDIETSEKSRTRNNHRASGQNVKEVETVVENSTSPYVEPNRQPKNHELKAALAVVKKVMKMDAAAPFNLPVDPVALGIPDYLDVIETPMDFSTVCNNIENGHKYRNSKDVFGDVQFIWDNCINYNKKGHYILELLQRVKKKFMILWTEAGLFSDQQPEIDGFSRLPTTKPDMACSIFGHKRSLGAPTDCAKHPKQDQVDLSRHQSHQHSLSYAHSYLPQRRPYHSPSSSPEPLACRTVDSLKAARRWNPCEHGCPVDAADNISTQAQFQLKQHQFPVGTCKSHQPRQTPCNCHPTHDQSQHSHPLTRTFIDIAEHSHIPSLRESSARRLEVGQRQCHQHPPAVNCSPHYQTQKRSCQDIPCSGRKLYAHSADEFDITNAGDCAHQQQDQPSCSYGHQHLPLTETCRGMLSSRKLPTSSAKLHADIDMGNYEGEFRSSSLAESMIRFNKHGPTKYPPGHMADHHQEQDKKSASPVHAVSDEPHVDVDMDSSDEFHSPRLTGSMISCAKRGPTISPRDATPNIIRNQQREISPSQIQHQKEIPEGPPSSSQPPPSHPQAPLDMFTTVPRDMKKKSRGRGPTRCLDVWNSENKIPVSTNEFGQAIGPEAPKFICFLGTVARNGHIAPLNYINWKAVPDENKERMWQLVESKFSINPQSKDSILKSIGTKWKNWKALLKANHYTPHETDEERLADCNERVQPDQWRILVSFWNSSEAKERSNTNKANRSKYTSNHACGSKSFARVLEEQRIKRPEGKGPSQADLFIVTRTRKNGEPVNEASSAIISRLRDAAQKEGTSEKDTIEDDVFLQVMGEETPGRVHTPGVGPTLYNLSASKPLPVEAVRIVSEANAEVREMREKMVAMEQTCAQMATQIATMMTMMQKNFSAKDTPNEDASNSSERLEHYLSSSHDVPSLQRSTRSGKK